MSSIIPVHYSSEDINQLKLKIESKNWISRLKFAQSEMEFYSFLLLTEAVGERLKSSSDTIMDQIPVLMAENKRVMTKIFEYKNQLNGIRECEDLQCEAFYLNDHETFRTEIESHIKKIQSLKSTVFELLRTALK